MPSVTYRGNNANLDGTTWEVPNEVVLSGKAAKWIEDTAATRAREEQQRLNQQAETTRSRKRRNDDLNKLTTLVGELANRLADLETQFETEPPDMATAALAANNTAAAIDRHHRLSQEALALQDEIEEPMQQANLLAEQSSGYLTQAATLRDQSLELIRNQQKLVNGAFSSFQPVIARLRDDIAELSSLVGELSAEASTNAETVRQAANITESAVGIARQTAETEVAAMRTEFYGVVNAVLQAIGLDRSAALQALNQVEVKGAGGVVLTRQEIAYYASLFTSASDDKAALNPQSTAAGVNRFGVSDA